MCDPRGRGPVRCWSPDLSGVGLHDEKLLATCSSADPVRSDRAMAAHALREAGVVARILKFRVLRIVGVHRSGQIESVGGVRGANRPGQAVSRGRML